MASKYRNFLFKNRIIETHAIIKVMHACRKYISTSSKVLSPNSYKLKSADQQFQQNRSHKWKLSKFYLYGIIPVVAYFVHRQKYFSISILPEVKAATHSTSRNRFNFIADIVEKSGSAVVCIDIKDNHRLDFFSWNAPAVTNGSGFIVEEDGLILTNAHVVMGHPQSAIQIKLADGTVYPGEVEDIDVKTDLATIRIKPKQRLSALKLSDSNDLRPGEWVIAMGSPLTLSNTVTAGIVSSANRTSSELQLHGKDMHYIQTDASITFGNSGGPLINLDGEVVGINSMKVALAGISFAIPIEYAKEFLQRSKQRKTNKTVTKRYLGLTMLTLNQEIIRELQYRNPYLSRNITEGVVVWKVVIGSPAHKSGLIPGDIVTDINGKRVTSSNAVYQALEKDSILNMKVYRGNGYLELVMYPEDVE